jgi:SNF family Na+-dependent transporter
MPPPGAFPPGYQTGDHIPRSFMNKRPIPAGADSNTRPYLIFFGYLGTCVLLTLYVIQKLLKNYIVLTKSPTARPPKRKHVLTFIGLAAGSLLTTWYYMVKYFQVSYKTWLMWRSYYEFTDEQNHWGLWLKDTSLFKEAWEIAIVGNARYWWTHQIFFFACALGLALEQKGSTACHAWLPK